MVHYNIGKNMRACPEKPMFVIDCNIGKVLRKGSWCVLGLRVKLGSKKTSLASKKQRE